MNRITGLAVAGFLSAVAFGMPSKTASAAVYCAGNFQITQHGPITTPYCQDNNLAQVAREYGMRVTNEAVRYNVGIKKQVCRLVGYDIRVKNTCSNYLPDSGRFRQ